MEKVKVYMIRSIMGQDAEEMPHPTKQGETEYVTDGRMAPVQRYAKGKEYTVCESLAKSMKNMNAIGPKPKGAKKADDGPPEDKKGDGPPEDKQGKGAPENKARDAKADAKAEKAKAKAEKAKAKAKAKAEKAKAKAKAKAEKKK